LFSHQIDFVAGKVITRNIVVSAPPWQGALQPTFLDRVDPAGDATGERSEIGNGQYDPSRPPRDPRHFGDRYIRAIEVIERTFADYAVETVVRKRQGIGPATDPQWRRTETFLGLHPREGRHPSRRFGPHRPSAPLRKLDRVLSKPTGHIQDSPPRSRPGELERAPGHSVE
jgi:hypothetical protein